MIKILYIISLIKLIKSNESIENVNKDKKYKSFKKDENDISLCMVGDTLMHRNLTHYGFNNKTNSYNFDFIFENMEKYIKEYDIKIVNEEVLIAGREFGVRDFPKFNSPFELADSIIKAGFNVILKATNHVNDLGYDALKSDLNNWKNKYPNIIVTGAYLTKEDSDIISYYTKNGIKIALLNYCYDSNVKPEKDFTMNKLLINKVEKDIKKAKNEGAEFIIVFPHWGKEYQLTESNNQIQWTNIFYKLGVDLVIGTHPHVIEPVQVMNNEIKKKMYIFYSLGNFINATAKRRKKNVFWRFLGGMAHVIIGRDKNMKVIVKDIKFIPLITHVFENRKFTTFKVKDYNKTMADNNFVKNIFDETYSYENMMNVFKEVINKDFLDFNL